MITHIAPTRWGRRTASGPDPAIERLRRLTPFATCTADELAFIAERTTVHHTRAGTYLARQHDIGYEFVVLVTGAATVAVDGRRVARLGPGDSFGELALIDHGARTADVVAETDVTAVVASAVEFEQIVCRSPAVVRALLESMARRLRDADHELGRRSSVPMA